MNSPYTAGQQLICINSKLSKLVEGENYTVKECVYKGDWVVTLEEVDGLFYPERFKQKEYLK